MSLAEQIELDLRAARRDEGHDALARLGYDEDFPEIDEAVSLGRFGEASRVDGSCRGGRRRMFGCGGCGTGGLGGSDELGRIAQGRT